MTEGEIARMREALAQGGGQHIGDFAWWEPGKNRVQRAHLEQVWQQNGMDPALLPDLPTPERAIRQAVRDAQTGRKDELARLGKEDELEIIYAILREHCSISGDVDHIQEAKVTLDRMTKTLAYDRNHDFSQEIAAGYTQLLTTHTTDEVRRMLVRTLRVFHGFALKANGGVYWVPKTTSANLDQLKLAVSQLDWEFNVVPVNVATDPRSMEAVQSIAASAERSLDDELGELAEEIKKFAHDPPRAATLERRLEQFEELRNRADLYRTILGVKVTDIENGLNVLTNAVERMIALNA